MNRRACAFRLSLTGHSPKAAPQSRLSVRRCILFPKNCRFFSAFHRKVQFLSACAHHPRLYIPPTRSPLSAHIRKQETHFKYITYKRGCQSRKYQSTAQSNRLCGAFSTTQEYLLYFKEFSCNLAENMQARCVPRFIQRFLNIRLFHNPAMPT